MHYAKKIIGAASTIGLIIPFLSHAAPEIVVTWKAASYVPEGYTGKALPVAGTSIDASAILVDGGKVINLAPYDINWYVGEDRVAGGRGISHARITAPVTGQDSFDLRVNVIKYKDQPLDAFVTMPVTRPRILITHKKNATPQGLSVAPYFWNIMSPDELEVTWSDNEDGITVQAANKKNALEFARSTIQKQ